MKRFLMMIAFSVFSYIPIVHSHFILPKPVLCTFQHMPKNLFSTIDQSMFLQNISRQSFINDNHIRSFVAGFYQPFESFCEQFRSDDISLTFVTKMAVSNINYCCTFDPEVLCLTHANQCHRREFVAAALDIGKVFLYDIKQNRFRQVFEKEEYQYVEALSFSSDNNLLAIATGFSIIDIYNVQTARCIKSVADAKCGPSSMAFIQDQNGKSKYFVYIHKSSRYINIVDLETSKKIEDLFLCKDNGKYYALYIAYEGRILVAVKEQDEEQVFDFYDMSQRKLIARRVYSIEGRIKALGLAKSGEVTLIDSRDNCYIASLDDDMVRVPSLYDDKEADLPEGSHVYYYLTHVNLLQQCLKIAVYFKA